MYLFYEKNNCFILIDDLITVTGELNDLVSARDESKIKLIPKDVLDGICDLIRISLRKLKIL